MRTTLTLDDDNAVRLERLRKERDVSLKEVVNDVIRRGLNDADSAPRKREPFQTKAMNLGEPLFSSPEELKALMRQISEEEELRKLGRT